jgi:hypothetical protein
MDYPKSTPNVGLVGGKFVDENAGTGQPGSLIPATWGNAVTDELLAVITAAGLEPSESDLGQLQKAIQAIAASDVKRTVRVATTGAIALSGVQTIDGVAVVAGDRVLVKDQAAGAQNWIYTVAVGAWVRALDANESAECTPGHLVIVESGTANAGSIWQLSNVTPPILGTTALVFAKVFGKTGVAAGSYRQVAVDQQGRVTAGSNPTTLGGYGIADAYTQTQVNNLLAGKAGNATTLAGYGITDAYTQTQVNNLLAGKAGNATTLAGYGIADAYTKTQADTLLNGKANKATTLAGYGITDGLRPGDFGGPVAATARHFKISSDLEPAATSWNTLTNEGLHERILLGTNPDGPGPAIYFYCRTYLRGGGEALQQFAEPYATPAGAGEFWWRGMNGNAWTPWVKCISSADQATQMEAEAGASQSTWMTPLQVLQAITKKVVQATESVAGIAKIATQALTNTGADDTSIVTPKKLRFGFTINLSSNGYIVLPSWMLSLIFQWGRVATPTADVDYAVTFPLAFPTAVRTIQVSYGYSGSRVNDAIVAQVGDYTLQGFQANRQDIGSTTSVPSAYISYFAIGY